MASSRPTFQLFVVSVDFNTKRRPKPPYSDLDNLLKALGGVLTPTLQIRLLLSPSSAKKIRDQITASLLRAGDRVYVGKIAKGSAWHNLRHISSAQLRRVLKTWAMGAEPTKAEITAARPAIS